MKTPDSKTHSGLRSLLIVGICLITTSPAIAKDNGAERVQHWGFQRDSDHNFDQKPDGWKRRQDRQHPAYIEMRIAPRSQETARTALAAQSTLANWYRIWETGQLQSNYIPESPPQVLSQLLDKTVLDNCLEISMDGGAAELVGPIFPMENRYSYAMTAELSCEKLNGHFAWIELHLLDQSQQTIQILSTEKLQGTTDWQRLDTEIASHPGGELHWGQIHLKVAPHNSTVLTGMARFDSINIYRMPRLSLHTPLRYHIAQLGEEFGVSCEAMGIRQHDAHVLFELQDHLGQRLLEHAADLEVTSSSGEAPTSQLASPAENTHDSPDSVRRAPHFVSTRSDHRSVDGQATWNLKLDKPGLYRVRVNLGAGTSESQQREILIGVLNELDAKVSGPFGWSLAAFDDRLSIDEVPELVSRFGASWLKLPVWFDPADALTADKLIALIERLQALGTQVVGKLDQPPQSLKDTFGDNHDQVHAVNIFREPKNWEPALEPVLTRIGMKLPWFQIGGDSDFSFIGKSELAETISGLRARMQTYSQELKLALNWTWLDPPPEATAAPWNAVHYTTSPQATATELEQYINQASTTHQLWVSIDPLAGSHYRLLDRVRDLTSRMLAIKRSAVSAAFVSDPLRPEFRLFTEDKKIGEMLIPWRELVHALGDAEYVGSIEMPAGSVNHVLTDQNETLMLIWNERESIEQAYLGDELHATDLFGRKIELETAQSERGTTEQRIPVTPWPIIIRGVDPDLIGFQMAFQLKFDSLSSSLVTGQTIPVSITNTLPQSATGKVTVVSPSLLSGDKSESTIQLSNSLNQLKLLPVFIRNDASAGVHRLRFDFDLISSKPYHFSIYRWTSLGSGDIELTWDVTRSTDGLTELRVQIRNESEQTVAFDCKLFPHGKPYHRFRIQDSKPGVTVQEIRLRLGDVAEGSEAWLRCEQVGTGRILNYRLPL
jgi:hypothetical protein